MLPPDSRIGRYEIQRRFAHGGMATLYLALDPVLSRRVALKLFLADVELPDAHDRFVREARAAAALSHPNIVTIYDYGDHLSQPYIVMEFIEGETLAAAIRRKALIPTSTKLQWMEQLCSAVGYAHANGVIHRDLKPLNIIVDMHGRLKVLDFGIARMRGTLASHATARIGTAGYMAPEQIRGGNIDPRSDLFSIGVVCYELLAFYEPFGAETDPAITNRILNEDPRSLPEVLPDVDPELADVVWKALRKDAAERFQDAESMREAFATVRRRLEALETDATIVPYTPPAANLEAPVDRSTTGTQRPSGPPRASRMTPGPDRRAEREALVRKRTAQIEDSLRLAREHLATGELEMVRSQCELVLQLDNAHPEALSLLETVSSKLGGAVRPIPARATGPHTPRVPPTVPPVPPRATPAPAPPAFESDGETVIAPAGTASVSASSDRRTPIPDQVGTSRGIEAAPHDETTSGSLISRPAPIAQPSALPPAAATTQPQKPAEKPSTPPSPVPRRGLAAWQLWTGVAVGAVVVIALGYGVAMRTRPQPAPPPPAAAPEVMTSVVVDATPWATITKVQRDSGDAVPLPESASTPIALQLGPGKYIISLAGPGPTPESRVVPIEVVGGTPLIVPLQQFTPMTADEYFAPYLKPQPAAREAPGRDQ